LAHTKARRVLSFPLLSSLSLFLFFLASCHTSTSWCMQLHGP
jgi:hypothetical protein